MTGQVQDVLSAASVIGAFESTDSAENNTSSTTMDPSASAGIGTQQTADVKEAERTHEGDNAGNENPEDKKKKQQSDDKMGEQSVSLMTKELNELMSRINCNIAFQYHKEVDVMTVKMIDKKTQKVIKEMPPEDMVENMIKAKDWLGAFLDKNA